MILVQWLQTRALALEVVEVVEVDVLEDDAIFDLSLSLSDMHRMTSAAYHI